MDIPTGEWLQRTALGGLETSVQGLGCMGMSEFYGPTDWDTSVQTIRQALDLGVTLLDTADMYGAGHNEVLVGRATSGRRDGVQIATKFGIDRTSGDDHRLMRGQPDFVKRSCDASLLRLGVDVIDLYYMHRPPEDVPIEETVGAMADLVVAGKVRYLGLSKVDEILLRRATSVHPIAAVQNEYSIWTREPVESMAPALRELSVGLVAYAPLGSGFLTGSFQSDRSAPSDSRLHDARMTGSSGAQNKRIVDVIARVATELGKPPAIVALAWVYIQGRKLGIPIVPIPGSRQPDRVRENCLAVSAELPAGAIAKLDTLSEVVRGRR